jgi:hypothetical protein
MCSPVPVSTVFAAGATLRAPIRFLEPAGTGPGRGRDRKSGPVPPVEQQPPTGRALDARAAFVDETVVMSAQQHEVLQASLAAERPGDDVVSVHEAPPLTAWVLTATVTSDQRTSHRSRDRASPSTDAQQFAVALEDRDEAAVAEQPPHDLRRQARPVGDRTLAVGIVNLVDGEAVGVDVDQDLMSLTTR